MKNTVLSKLYFIADHFPEKVAIIQGDDEMCYSELHQKSNQLANYLISKGVKKNDVIGLCMDRSCSMMISIFAIMKAGGAYLPLDINYPENRLESILDDSKIKYLILTDEWNKSIEYQGEFVHLNNLNLCDFSNENPDVLIDENDLAYVIYTSGSTGKPKGVAIEHAGLFNRIEWMQSEYPIKDTDKVFFKTIYTFDVSVWEIFWAAMYGASVVLLPSGKEHDVKLIARLIKSKEISVVHFVPSVFILFTEYLEIKKDSLQLDSLKYVFASGEKLTTTLVNSFNWLFQSKQALLINLYGPTEASIDVTHFPFRDKNIHYVDAPIGSAIDNIRLYVLDENLNEVEEGKEGTLYIAGIGLARGYYKNNELTNQKFITHPFVTNERIYDTGDIVFRKNTIVHYIGRKDFQIKLRGLRIELSDIERNINNINGVTDSVVIVSENSGNQLLIAFYKAQDELSEYIIKQELIDSLPNYMIPNTFIQLHEFPLTSSGKLDRKQLLENYLK